MPLPVPPFIPDADLERRASGVLRQYEQDRGRPVSLPVPIEHIIERTLSLQLVWVTIEEQPGEIILARIDPAYQGRPTIQLNERRQDHFEEYFGTEQYSLAHEVGHWVLHLDRGRSRQLGFQGFMGAEDTAPLLCRRMSDSDRREFQAERFAAFLIMPEDLIREAATGHDLTHWSSVAELARACGVSKRALVRRLDDLALVTVQPDGQLARPGGRRGSPPLL